MITEEVPEALTKLQNRIDDINSKLFKNAIERRNLEVERENAEKAMEALGPFKDVGLALEYARSLRKTARKEK